MQTYTPAIINGRRTGRTTAMLVDAVKQALEGHKVLVIVAAQHDFKHARDTFAKLFDFTPAQVGVVIATVDAIQRGCVLGSTFHSVSVDHAVRPVGDSWIQVEQMIAPLIRERHDVG